MSFTRIAAIAALTFVAGCASAPPRQAERLEIPPRAQTRAAYVEPTAALEVCRGMHVSNAPAADNNLRLVGYTPVSHVYGVTLTRSPVAPVVTCVSSGYGPRAGGASGFHNGVDLYTRTPAPVHAGGDGVVSFVGVMSGYGNTIEISHGNGVKTRYAHLSSYSPQVTTGARVSRGDPIGQTGRSGNATAIHLHYEVIVDGRRQNPLTVGG